MFYTVKYFVWQALEKLSCRTQDFELPLGLEAESNTPGTCSLHETKRPRLFFSCCTALRVSDNNHEDWKEEARDRVRACESIVAFAVPLPPTIPPPPSHKAPIDSAIHFNYYILLQYLSQPSHKPYNPQCGNTVHMTYGRYRLSVIPFVHWLIRTSNCAIIPTEG